MEALPCRRDRVGGAVLFFGHPDAQGPHRIDPAAACYQHHYFVHGLPLHAIGPILQSPVDCCGESSKVT